MLHHSDIIEEDSRLEYIEALIDSFEQIDVNGDETLEWDEFSNYIVETGKINLKNLKKLKKELQNKKTIL
jgi:hypothetical protein